ncbi:twin-arginine translocase TatA/TatE family subunit [Paenibacillus radicis (ex Xue et al. 2023)]|uniref:Sec-independent protein translocase protein TatA n=1 Tax=Paenibacillus radicis (ex Xue et al. 2023) TaxID=2972489 RepID=A0ABT1YRZ9_9BACL|nr:twin-arginine translocase TatA/TatE family subunit [Paenibacillus radicis (ex Xue et al. 2023)]MCR8635959.1 twin-arginine translocase TatA/TatE family subunit [Paenibacillus radicis (ex Xue et al. 2023)]
MSLSHMLLIAVVVLVLFGPSKLPELGRAIGKTMREFKKGAQDLMEDVHASAPKEERKDVTPRPAPDPVSGMMLPPVAAAPERPVQQAQQAQTQQEQGTKQAAQQIPQEKPADTRRLPE